MFNSSFIEISRSALQNNIDFLKKIIGPQVQFSSVIKGNAYGHGIEQFAPLAQECGVSHFSVFSADEALRLTSALLKPATILIMGYLDNDELEWAIQNEIEFFVFEPDRLNKAIEIAKKLGRKARIHVELETGMNRTGFDPNALQFVVSVLESNKQYLQLKGLCTHFAGAESIQNHDRIMAQQHSFKSQVASLLSKNITSAQLHTACSAAMMSYPETHMDMVRVGIMQYGFWPSPETHSQYFGKQENKIDPLQRLINWKTRVMSLKTVPQGEYIGYGTTYRASQDMTVAIIPVGYSWGYSRSLSNLGHVLIHGQQANVVGNVNMNVMMVDVTHITNVQKEDEVVLLGKQGTESITVASFGELSTQLNYELLTRLPLNIPRFITD